MTSTNTSKAALCTYMHYIYFYSHERKGKLFMIEHWETVAAHAATQYKRTMPHNFSNPRKSLLKYNN